MLVNIQDLFKKFNINLHKNEGSGWFHKNSVRKQRWGREAGLGDLAFRRSEPFQIKGNKKAQGDELKNLGRCGVFMILYCSTSFPISIFSFFNNRNFLI